MSAQINNKKFIPIVLVSIVVIGLVLFVIYKVQNKKPTGELTTEETSLSELKENETQINSDKKEGDLKVFKDSISLLLIKVDSLENTIRALKNRKDTIVYKEKKVIEKVPEYIYREKQEYYRFGKDKGKILIYSVCDPRVTRQIFIDGKSVGKLTQYYTDGRPDCNSNDISAKISLVVSSGKHHIEIKENSYTWEFYTDVIENICNYVPLGCN